MVEPAVTPLLRSGDRSGARVVPMKYRIEFEMVDVCRLLAEKYNVDKQHVSFNVETENQGSLGPLVTVSIESASPIVVGGDPQR